MYYTEALTQYGVINTQWPNGQEEPFYKRVNRKRQHDVECGLGVMMISHLPNYSEFVRDLMSN